MYNILSRIKISMIKNKCVLLIINQIFQKEGAKRALQKNAQFTEKVQ